MELFIDFLQDKYKTYDKNREELTLSLFKEIQERLKPLDYLTKEYIIRNLNSYLKNSLKQ